MAFVLHVPIVIPCLVECGLLILTKLESTGMLSCFLEKTKLDFSR